MWRFIRWCTLRKDLLCKLENCSQPKRLWEKIRSETDACPFFLLIYYLLVFGAVHQNAVVIVQKCSWRIFLFIAFYLCCSLTFWYCSCFLKLLKEANRSLYSQRKLSDLVEIFLSSVHVLGEVLFFCKQFARWSVSFFSLNHADKLKGCLVQKG